MADYEATRHIETDETSNLISASKVQGTAVYSSEGTDMGTIYDVMLEKVGGKVAYAVMSIGGFLGLGADYHPVPWNKLTYDVTLGGYMLAETIDRLKAAPTLASDYASDPEWGGRNPGWTGKVNDYYGVAI